ncbi:ABC transporter ATP-binding protein [Stomatohabitans albus]|uniref:ABC transporter ATP-binding protein n=1 Tax=Stomatohabitans albus TaxID=3110766 RepID=UPI003AB9622D
MTRLSNQTELSKKPDTIGGQPLDMNAPLLEVKDLSVEFRTDSGVVHATNQLTWTLNEGETVAILGESGSGKSVSSQAVMGILDSPPGFITNGTAKFRGVDLLKLTDKEKRQVQGRRIAMIFQDALTALNPVYTVGWQISEMFRVHEGLSRREARERSIDLLGSVGIPSPELRYDNYPHEFSGGMRQRAMIAMAISLDPDVLIADEPTTALDVTVQAQVMELLASLQQRYNMGLVLITHDLGVVAGVADRLVVMYAGTAVERAGVMDLYGNPLHPYTRGLMDSIPRADQVGGRLNPIIGQPPDLSAIPPGCPFHPRCPIAVPGKCNTERPTMRTIAEGRDVACHFAEVNE